MNLENFDLVASLQGLPETDPVEIEGVQFGGDTCQGQCTNQTVIVQTVCAVVATCV